MLSESPPRRRPGPTSCSGSRPRTWLSSPAAAFPPPCRRPRGRAAGGPESRRGARRGPAAGGRQPPSPAPTHPLNRCPRPPHASPRPVGRWAGARVRQMVEVTPFLPLHAGAVGRAKAVGPGPGKAGPVCVCLSLSVCVCVSARARAFVRACMHVRACACVRVRESACACACARPVCGGGDGGTGARKCATVNTGDKRTLLLRAREGRNEAETGSKGP